MHASAPVYVRVEARDQLVSRVLTTSFFSETESPLDPELELIDSAGLAS